MSSWTLDLPDSRYITPNSRTHWSVRSRCARTWRDATCLLARQAGIPTLHHAHVALEMHPRDRRRRDADNLVSGVLKHCIDGLRDAQVIVDDDPAHVTSAMPTIVPPDAPRQGPHRWILTVSSEDG